MDGTRQCQEETMAEYKIYVLGETGMIARGIWLWRLVIFCPRS